MTGKNRITGYFFTFLATILILLSFSFSGNAQTFPDGLVGLSSDDPAVLYSINPNTGAATPIVTLNGGASFTGLSYLLGTLYGTDLFNFPGSMADDIGSIATNGIITFLGDQNGSSDWHGLASDDCGGGILYTIDINNNFILTAQFTDGSVTLIGPTGISGRGMAYDDRNDILYAVDINGSLYTVSVTTGTSNLIGPTGIIASTVRIGLAYDEINRILYANVGPLGMSGELYTLDVTTGAATLVGSNGESRIDGLAWKDRCVIKPIPTLSEWGLIAMAGILGIIGILAIKRRKVTA